jgi:hypothetical protein
MKSSGGKGKGGEGWQGRETLGIQRMDILVHLFCFIKDKPLTLIPTIIREGEEPGSPGE